MASFEVPVHVIFHELGHVLAGIAAGLGIKSVRVDPFSGGNTECLIAANKPEPARMMCMAGPIAQKRFDPDSIKPEAFKGLLFDPCRSGQQEWWAHLRDLLRRDLPGWRKDLDWIYAEVWALWKPETAGDLIGTLSVSESRLEIFFADPAVLTAAQEIFEPLMQKRSLEGAEILDILSHRAEIPKLQF